MQYRDGLEIRKLESKYKMLKQWFSTVWLGTNSPIWQEWQNLNIIWTKKDHVALEDLPHIVILSTYPDVEMKISYYIHLNIQWYKWEFTSVKFKNVFFRIAEAASCCVTEPKRGEKILHKLKDYDISKTSWSKLIIMKL